MIWTYALLFHWAGWVSVYFALFWHYLPFAIAAQELADLQRRYS